MYDITFTIISFISVTITVLLLIMLERAATNKLLFGKTYYFFAILVLTVWSFFYFLECSSTDIEAKKLLIKLQYVTIIFFPVSLWMLTKKFFFNIGFNTVEIISIVTLAFLLCYLIVYNPGGYLYTSDQVVNKNDIIKVVVEYGPLFYVLYAFFCLICTVMTTLLIIRMVRVRNHRTKIFLAIIAIISPLVTSILFYLNITFRDYSIISFTVTSLAIFLNFVFFGHFDATAYVKRYLLELQNDLILIINDRNQVTYANSIVFKLINKTFNRCIGREIEEIFPGYNIKNNYVYKTSGENGEIVEINFKQVPIPQKIKIGEFQLIVGRNMTDINKTNQQLDYLLTHDRSTGLINRGVLVDIMKKFQERSNSGLAGTFLYGIGVYNSNVLIGITNVEKRHQIESEIANHIRRNTSPGNTIAYFGENRYLIFSNSASYELNLLVKSLQELPILEIALDNKRVILDLRIGVYVIEGGVSADDAVSNTLYALNSSLQNFNTKLKVYDKNMKLSHGIHRYIMKASNQLKYDKHFELTYQPIIDVVDKCVAGAQVFVKWNNPALGRLATETFIPAFEDTGDIVDLEMYIIERLCQDLAEWGDIFPKQFFFTMNISKLQFQNSSFISSLSHFISANNVNPQRINLKLREGLEEHNIDNLIKFVNELHKIGVLITLDDFGSSNSSVVHVIKFKCDMIAVHSNLTYNAQIDRDDDLIIRTLFRMCNELKVKLIIQHVESYNNLKAFENMGIHYIQGYVFSHALKPAEFITYIENFDRKL